MSTQQYTSPHGPSPRGPAGTSPSIASSNAYTIQKKPRAVGIGCTVLPTKNGMMVQKVQPESRAYAAGVSENDIIMEINNQPIRSLEDMMKTLPSRTEPILKILRASSGKCFHVTLSALDVMRPLSTNTTKTPFGIIFERREHSILVKSVNVGGVADIGGLKAGDVLVQIGSDSLAGLSENDVKQILGAVPEGSVVSIVVIRNGLQLTLQIERSNRPRIMSPPLIEPPDLAQKPLTHEELLSHMGPLPDVQSLMKSAPKSAFSPISNLNNNNNSPSSSSSTSSTLPPKPHYYDHTTTSGNDEVRDLLRTLSILEDNLRKSEAARVAAEHERHVAYEALRDAMVKQAEGIDKLLRQSLLRERDLSNLVTAAQRGEDVRRSAEEGRERNEKDRCEAEKVRHEEEQRRKNGELERHMLVKQHESALDAFKRNMQKSEGEAWGRLGVLIDSLKNEKASVRQWVDKLNDEHRRVREQVQSDVDRIKTMFREVESRISRVDDYWRTHDNDVRRTDAESRQRFEAVEAALRDAQGILNRDIINSRRGGTK